MVTQSDNSSISCDPADGTAGGGALPPLAAGAAAAEPSPRTVIREESLIGESPGSDGKPLGAFTDFLNVTFRLPEWKDPAAGFFYRLTEVVGSAFGIMEDQKRGLHGYEQSYRFERGGVRFAFGGQSNTALLSIPGEGCAFVKDWDHLVELCERELQARITRWDGATDDFEGVHSVDDAVALYLAGAFNGGGRKPAYDQRGSWIVPDGAGRTFYVGKRRNGKLLRVYEKGKQLGAKESPWTRWEVELHNIDRVIPWEVISEPARFIAGAYPALSWVSNSGSRIPTLRRTDGISYERIVFYARVAYGRLIDTMLHRDQSAEDVVRQLRREGVPERLALSESLGVRGEPKA